MPGAKREDDAEFMTIWESSKKSDSGRARKRRSQEGRRGERAKKNRRTFTIEGQEKDAKEKRA